MLSHKPKNSFNFAMKGKKKKHFYFNDRLKLTLVNCKQLFYEMVNLDLLKHMSAVDALDMGVLSYYLGK